MQAENSLAWRQLVTPGHTWQARLNRVTWIGALLLALFALSLARDIHGNTIGLGKAMATVDAQEPGTWFERFRAAPWATLRGSLTGGAAGDSQAPRPTLSTQAIQPFPDTDLDVSGLTPPSELVAFVKLQLDALQRTGKLSAEYDCDPMTSLKGAWVNSKTGTPNIPRCKVSADTVWLASLVAEGEGMYQPAVPWLGVFHVENGTWAYRNVQLPTVRTVALPGFDSLPLDYIAYQAAKDFPDLVAPPAAAVTTNY